MGCSSEEGLLFDGDRGNSRLPLFYLSSFLIDHKLNAYHGCESCFSAWRA